MAVLKASGRKDLAKIVDPGNVKAGGASLLLRNLVLALDAAPNDQALPMGGQRHVVNFYDLFPPIL